MSINILRSAIDTYADEAQPGQNFGARGRLWVRGTGSTARRWAYIYFGKPFPTDALIESATLRLYLGADWASATITVARITQSWKEDRLTWNNKPAATTTNQATSSSVSGSTDQEVAIDVTPMIGDVAAGQAFYGVRLTLSVDSSRALWSGENPDADLRPQLEIEWSTEPYAPDHLAPAGGRAISATKPVLSWRFKDQDEGTQIESQVQVHSSGDFTTPIYDSGWQANTDTQWDLSTTAFPALANDDVRYWRVRVKDDSGLISDWSDTVSFSRQSKGTLTLVNPGVSGVVDEVTPPISWTFTGRTQERAHVWVYEVPEAVYDDTAAWDAGVDTETSITVPRGIIVSDVNYEVKLRVWDTIDREARPGDPRYVEAIRPFTYDKGSPGVTPVATLTAEAHGPMVTLTWTRATQPDFWSLRIDGKEIEPRIEPMDVFVSGTTYSMDVWRGRPGSEHTYEIEPVVNSKHAAANPVVSQTSEKLGIWLIDDDDITDPLAVEIRGIEQPDMAIRESSEVFELIGQRKPVRIIDSIGGYGGTINGLLLNKAERDRAERIKGRQGGARRARLIISDLNFPVSLGELSLPPTPDPQGRYEIAFEFDQVADWTFRVGRL